MSFVALERPDFLARYYDDRQEDPDTTPLVYAERDDGHVAAIRAARLAALRTAPEAL